MSGRALALAALLLLVTGCSCGARPPPVSSPSPPPPAPPPTAVFDVHEWGLLDVSASGAQLVAGPPGGPTDWNAPRRKPVLYFHVARGGEVPSVTVTITGAPIFENFPSGSLSADRRTLTWAGLHVRDEHCPVTGAPTADSAECQTADHVCEATELATYETADASCIDAAGMPYNHLFYRGNGPPPPLPLDVVVTGSRLKITRGRATDLVGPLLYVSNVGGNVTVDVLAMPAVGADLSPPAPTGTDLTAAQLALDEAMKTSGLSSDEVAAFDRAWANDLFGSAAAARDLSVRRGPAGPSDYLLYVMPLSLIDGASHVAITPAPRTLKRFLLVRVAV